MLHHIEMRAITPEHLMINPNVVAQNLTGVMTCLGTTITLSLDVGADLQLGDPQIGPHLALIITLP